MPATFTAMFRTIRDGAFFDIEYDLGFDIKVTYLSRLTYPNSDAPLYVRDKAYGKTAKQWVTDWYVQHPVLEVELVKRENGVVYIHIIDGDTTLNQHLIDQGYELIPSDKRDSRVPLYEEEGITVPKLITFGEDNPYSPDNSTHVSGRKSWVF